MASSWLNLFGRRNEVPRLNVGRQNNYSTNHLDQQQNGQSTYQTAHGIQLQQNGDYVNQAERANAAGQNEEMRRIKVQQQINDSVRSQNGYAQNPYQSQTYHGYAQNPYQSQPQYAQAFYLNQNKDTLSWDVDAPYNRYDVLFNEVNSNNNLSKIVYHSSSNQSWVKVPIAPGWQLQLIKTGHRGGSGPAKKKPAPKDSKKKAPSSKKTKSQTTTTSKKSSKSK